MSNFVTSFTTVLLGVTSVNNWITGGNSNLVTLVNNCITVGNIHCHSAMSAQRPHFWRPPKLGEQFIEPCLCLQLWVDLIKGSIWIFEGTLKVIFRLPLHFKVISKILKHESLTFKGFHRKILWNSMVFQMLCNLWLVKMKFKETLTQRRSC